VIQEKMFGEIREKETVYFSYSSSLIEKDDSFSYLPDIGLDLPVFCYFYYPYAYGS